MTLSLVRSWQALSTPTLLVGLDPSRDTQGFSSSPVLSVWALCHGCCTWLRVKKYALPGVLVCVICLPCIRRLPWWDLSQPPIFFPPQAPYWVLSSQPLFLRFPVLLHASLLPLSVIFHTSACPLLVFISILLVQLVWLFCPAPYSTFLHCPGIVYFLCLAYPGPLILFLIPVSV